MTGDLDAATEIIQSRAGPGEVEIAIAAAGLNFKDVLTVLGTAATGICYGAIFPLFPAAVADFYGVKNLGVNYGLVFTGFGVAGVLGPILGSKLRDVSGSWTLSFIVSACLLVLAAGLAFYTKVQAQRLASAAPETADKGGH